MASPALASEVWDPTVYFMDIIVHVFGKIFMVHPRETLILA